MEVVCTLSDEFTAPLSRFRDWVLNPDHTRELQSAIYSRELRYGVDRGQETCSLEYLMAIDHANHVGYPTDMLGIDLNYEVLARNPNGVGSELVEEIRSKGHELDDSLQTVLGARFCALKAYYPAGGHIGWHTNWNAPGFNIVFTYSPTGNGFWRHISPSGKAGGLPSSENLVHIPDPSGWHCKMGYFGAKHEVDRIKWHCAYTREPRLTVSYVFHDKNIWENVVEEIRSIE